MDASGRPGFIASSAAHAALLLAMLISFSHNPKFTDAPETIPVDLVTDSDVNQIVKGDKSARTVQDHPHVDKVDTTSELKPKPPIAAAKRDVPTPPPPLKHIDDPGDSDKAAPPKPPVEAAAPPPAPKAPPLPPITDKPPPDMAADEPLPPPRPETPPPKKPPPKVVAKQRPKFQLDQIAKLLDEDKPPKPAKSREPQAAKPKSGDDSHEQRRFSADDIARLLSKEAPERRASTGDKLQQLASLGSPTASAPRMSPSLQAAMDGWFQDRFQGCWTQPITLPQGPKYIPQIRVRLNLDGSLAADPTLLNPPDDPAWQALADSAIRAVRECNPLPIPDRFKTYYDAWRDRVVQFQDQDM